MYPTSIIRIKRGVELHMVWQPPLALGSQQVAPLPSLPVPTPPTGAPPVPPPTHRKLNGANPEVRIQPSSPEGAPCPQGPPIPLTTVTSPRSSAARARLQREDSARDNVSENSFQTASSDPQINLIPRQISESYQQLPQAESKALERKSSVRALQAAQYSALRAHQPQGSNGHSRPANRTQAKGGR